MTIPTIAPVDNPPLVGVHVSRVSSVTLTVVDVYEVGPTCVASTQLFSGETTIGSSNVPSITDASTTVTVCVARCPRQNTDDLIRITTATVVKTTVTLQK